MNDVNPAPQDNDQNPDVTKQYQDILDKYAQDIKTQPPAETPDVPAIKTTTSSVLSQNIDVEENEPAIVPASTPEPAPAPTVSPEPIVASNNEPSVPPQPTPEITPEPALSAPPLTEPPAMSPPVNPKGSILPKIFFLFSLLLFITIYGILTFTYFKNKSNTNQSNTAPTPTTVATQSGAGCSLNDQNYATGQSFLASDNCNTCTCKADGNIDCTAKTCLATDSAKPTIKLSPTKTSSSSGNIPKPSTSSGKYIMEY